MQSSPAKGSQLWSCQRSGDHEETVQVPHTQRVCAQDKGTALRINASLCPVLINCNLYMNLHISTSMQSLFVYLYVRIVYS